MQKTGLSHSNAANNADVRKENEQPQVSFRTDQFSLSVQLFEGSIYTVAAVCSFLASW